MKKIIALGLMAMLPLFAACGGGGGGGSDPTAATLTISAKTGTLPAGKQLSGFRIAIELPTGVTVKMVTGTQEVDPTVIVPTAFLGNNTVPNKASISQIKYTAAVSPAKAKLEFIASSGVALPGGVGEGAYVTVDTILTGVSPTADSFTITTFEPYDQNVALMIPPAALQASKSVVLK